MRKHFFATSGPAASGGAALRGLGPSAAWRRRRQGDSGGSKKASDGDYGGGGDSLGGSLWGRGACRRCRSASVSGCSHDRRSMAGRRATSSSWQWPSPMPRVIGLSDVNEEKGAGTAMPDKDAEVELDDGAGETTASRDTGRFEIREDTNPWPPAPVQRRQAADCCSSGEPTPSPDDPILVRIGRERRRAGQRWEKRK